MEENSKQITDDSRLFRLHDKYIRGTDKKAPVILKRLLIARLPTVVVEGICNEWPDFKCDKVYISTKAMKHIFDGRMAQEYEFILKNLPYLINQPDDIFENLDEKKGELLIAKSFEFVTYEQEKKKETMFCSLDISNRRLGVTTAFRQPDERKKENYTKKYKPMWSWGGD